MHIHNLIISSFLILLLAAGQVAAAGTSGVDSGGADALVSGSVTKPTIRTSSLDHRVREFIGRYPIEPGEYLPDAVEAFLKANNDAFGLWGKDSEPSFKGRETEPHITVLNYQELYKGVPVWGQTVEVQVNNENEVVVVVNKTAPHAEIAIDPKVDRDAVLAKVRAEWNKARGTELPPCGVELVIYKDKLAYLVRATEGTTSFGFIMDASDASTMHAFKTDTSGLSSHCKF